MKENKAMGERFQELRHARGLSQAELAKLADIPPSTLKNWEQGRREPLFRQAVRLAKALGISLDALAGAVFADKPASKGKTRRKGKGGA